MNHLSAQVYEEEHWYLKEGNDCTHDLKYGLPYRYDLITVIYLNAVLKAGSY